MLATVLPGIHQRPAVFFFDGGGPCYLRLFAIVCGSLRMDVCMHGCVSAWMVHVCGQAEASLKREEEQRVMKERQEAAAEVCMRDVHAVSRICGMWQWHQ